jgi:hypothetical protein
MAGVAPGVRIVPLKALDCQGTGSLSNVANAIDFAADSGISIINLSVSGQMPTGCPSYLLAAINRALQGGTVIVGAVGNNGSTDVEYPSGCTGVVGVGATDNTDTIWSFSNRNSAVALTAPGVSIESSWKDGNYAIGDGTSLSTPHVAGCAALIRSLNPALSAAATRQVLQSTAIDLGAPGYDTSYGSGRLDCGAAVKAATTGPIGTTPTTVTTPGSSAGKGLTITSGNGGVTLSWQAGTGQTGFNVVRLVNGQITVLPPGGLPATATTYTDTAAPPGFDCYALLVNGPGTVGVSDLECAMVGFGAGSSPPQGFALRLNQSSTATLTWAPPASLVDSYLVVPLSGVPQPLPGSQTSATVPLTGLGCFTIASIRGGAIQGYTDLLCGLPGFTNLGAASGVPTALAISAALRP